jgi:hypothetical protein
MPQSTLALKIVGTHHFLTLSLVIHICIGMILIMERISHTKILTAQGTELVGLTWLLFAEVRDSHVPTVVSHKNPATEDMRDALMLGFLCF